MVDETCYMLEREGGPHVETDFLHSLQTPLFEQVDITDADLARMAELVERYADFPLGAVDASVIAVAERLKVRQVATLDRKHFNVVRANHCGALTLLP